MMEGCVDGCLPRRGDVLCGIEPLHDAVLHRRMAERVRVFPAPIQFSFGSVVQARPSRRLRLSLDLLYNSVTLCRGQLTKGTSALVAHPVTLSFVRCSCQTAGPARAVTNRRVPCQQ